MRSLLARLLATLAATVVGVAVVAIGVVGVLQARGVDVQLPEGAAIGADATEEPVETPTTEATETTAPPGPTESTDPTEEPSTEPGDDRDRHHRHRHHHRDEPLAGEVVVIDPGHQLGNSAHPSEINRQVDAGGFEKACNTTGTSTDAGYPEATFTWEVAVRMRHDLEDLGAKVLMTRDANSTDLWGPCVDERGRAGNPGEPGPTADLKISIHGDGTYQAGAHGFHVIAPGDLPGYTDDIESDSLDLAEVLRDALVDEGFAVSTYTGRNGIDVRTDLGTLNLSDVPTALVELGNMRDPGDAAVMSSADGQRRYARALAAAVKAYLR